MTSLPLVSILVPFYKAERYIERCARSVFEQTYPDLEIIFLDDCSPDYCGHKIDDVLSDYPHRYTQTRLIKNNCNLGIASTRNKAVSLCSGSFITWVDADDYLEKNAVERMVDLQQRSNADIVSGCIIEHSTQGTLEYALFPEGTKEQTLYGLLDLSLRKNLWGRLIRTSLYKNHQVACIDGINHHEDYLVLSKLVYYADSLVNLPEVVYHYDRSNENSIISLSHSNNERSLIKCRQDLASVNILKSFFSDKGEPWSKLANEAVSYYMREVLRVSTRLNERALFISTARQLAQTDWKYVQRYGKNLWIMAHISPALCWYIKKIRFHFLEH